MIAFVLFWATVLAARWVLVGRSAVLRRFPLIAAALPGALAICFAWALPKGLILQKVLAALAMPAGALFCLLLAGSFVAWHKRLRGCALFLAVVTVGHTIAGNDMVEDYAFSWLEADYAHLRPLEEPPFDALIVLGGGTDQQGPESAKLNAQGDRVFLAGRMYRAGRTPVLVATGRSIEGLGTPRVIAEETAFIWAEMGIPPEAIVLVPDARNTSQEMAAIRELIRQRGWQRVGLVTSAWHMRRAQALWEREGLTLHPVPADRRSSISYDGLLSIIPNGHSYLGNHLALWEILGAAVGR